MKLRVYLDTSVFSAALDDRQPDRRDETLALFSRLPQLAAVTSEVTRDEMARTRNDDLRKKLTDLLVNVSVVPITAEMKSLALEFIGRHIFTANMVDDAKHIASAVLSDCELLLSWNFKHLVNRRRRAMVNQVNLSLGLRQLEIIAPAEMAYE